MNRFSIIGRITRDIDLTTTNSGISVAKFNVAVDRKFKNESGEKITDFFNVVVWRALAENIAKYCKKGSKVFLSGELQNSSWEAEDGTKRYKTELVASECEFLDNKSSTIDEPVKETTELEEIKDEDLPF